MYAPLRGRASQNLRLHQGKPELYCSVNARCLSGELPGAACNQFREQKWPIAPSRAHKNTQRAKEQEINSS